MRCASEADAGELHKQSASRRWPGDRGAFSATWRRGFPALMDTDRSLFSDRRRSRNRNSRLRVREPETSVPHPVGGQSRGATRRDAWGFGMGRFRLGDPPLAQGVLHDRAGLGMCAPFTAPRRAVSRTRTTAVLARACIRTSIYARGDLLGRLYAQTLGRLRPTEVAGGIVPAGSLRA